MKIPTLLGGYCERLVAEPARTHLVLISDLYEGGDATEMLARAELTRARRE